MKHPEVFLCASSLALVMLSAAACTDPDAPESSVDAGAGASSGGSAGAAPGAGGTSTSTGGGSTSEPGSCGTVNPEPLGCAFAWGAPRSGSNDTFLDFVSTWVGYESRGGLDGDCDGCRLVQELSSSDAQVVYYAYFIGFQANLMGGFGDCNVDMSDGHNLCSDGAQWIRDNRELIVEMYGTYAKASFDANPEKPVIWWLEGDYVQYSYADQSNPLSFVELGELARDITCAIKSNAPNAVVAMNHSPWISDEQAAGFWSAMPMDVLDLVWVQGPGNDPTFVNSGEYNQATANFAWLSEAAGRPIMAETSFAGSGQDDRWTTASTSDINARIAEGVIGVLINNPGSNLSSQLTALRPDLVSVCH